MNMKTIKNILYALFALAAFVMVGCTNDQTYTPGGDLSGEQIYIDNSTSVFYVKTAEEKEEEAKELKQLSKGVHQVASAYADDSYIDLLVVRKSGNTEEYAFNVMLTMLAEDMALFTLPAGSTQAYQDAAAKTVTYTVPCVFDAEVAETTLRIGFDIDAIETNTEYEFVAELEDKENASNYGASEFEFSIMHSLPIELPFEDCGSITLEETFFRDLLGAPVGIYSDCLIQIHKDDKKAIDDAKIAGTAPELAAGYVRFYIPRFMYQVVSASVAAGDGAFEESDLDYFAQGCGIMVCMTPTYELVTADMAGNYPHPLHPDKVSTGYPRSPAVFVDSVDGGVYSYGFSFGKVYAGTVPLSVSGIGTLEIVLFYPELGYSEASTRSMNTYTLNTSYFAAATGNLWSTPVIFTWDKNTLEDDWANYFKVDYNNDVTYHKMGEGVFTSEYQGNFATKTLYTGIESVSGATVYYIDNPYGTATDETGALGLALTWNGTIAKLVDNQPLNMQWNGRELYASQSKTIDSAIEFNEKGAIKKITLGLAIVNEEGAVLGDYTETFDIESNPVGLEAFLGEHTHVYYSVWGPADRSAEAAYYNSLYEAIEGSQTPVVIEQAKDAKGNPIKNKVIIKGLIDSYYTTALGGADSYLEATYDPISDRIDVPAQFFHDAEWDGTLLGLSAANLGLSSMPAIYPYFQPGITNVADYNYGSADKPAYYWTSELATTADCISIYKDASTGSLVFDSSFNSADIADGYAIILGYHDGSSWVMDYEYFALYTTFSWPQNGVNNPHLVPTPQGGGTEPGAAQQKFASRNRKAANLKFAKRGEKMPSLGLTIKK